MKLPTPSSDQWKSYSIMRTTNSIVKIGVIDAAYTQKLGEIDAGQRGKPRAAWFNDLP